MRVHLNSQARRPRVSASSLAVAVASSVLLTAALGCGGAVAATATQVAVAGTVSAQTGDFVPSGSGDVTTAEFPNQLDGAAGPAPFGGMITDRSLSKGTGNGVSVASGQKAKSNPQFVTGFEGLNLYQQRYARGGNQFTVEPPDQALCAGNGYVVEAVNDVINVYNTSGQSVLPDNTATNIVSGYARNVNHAIDLNSFFGYRAAINRSTGVRAQFLTDPSCLYDAATQRFFVVVLTLETRPNGSLTLVNHLDIAVSQTANPAGYWTIYKLDVTNDGTNTGGVNPGPYLGDYPHIGADAYGFYVTTNAYPWLYNGFGGAQIYALSKSQLAASSPVNAVHIDTSGLVQLPSDAGPTQPGFTVWPAQSPGANSFNLGANGTEYFLSSNAADEATHPVAGFGGNYVSNKLILWTLTNTSSLDSAAPAVSLTNSVLGVNTYAIPPKQQQPRSGQLADATVPLGYCINDTTTVLFNGQSGCWRLLFGGQPALTEVVSTPDANDTRMQQVTYANGKLWAALDTAINPDGGASRAGIAWYVIKPSSAKVAMQGYLGAAGHDFTYPTIGVTPSGRGIMAFTASGDALNPSAAFAPMDAIVGVGPWSVVNGGTGGAADDGFTSYKAFVGSPPRTRWGDYGAVAVDGDSIWLASEYVANACSFTEWGGPYFAGGGGDNLLGTCAGVPGGVGKRTALGNWSTRITLMKP